MVSRLLHWKIRGLISPQNNSAQHDVAGCLGVEGVGERFSAGARGGSNRRQDKDPRRSSLWDAHIWSVRANSRVAVQANARGSMAPQAKQVSDANGTAPSPGGAVQLSSDLHVLVNEGAITLQQAQAMMAEAAIQEEALRQTDRQAGRQIGR